MAQEILTTTHFFHSVAQGGWVFDDVSEQQSDKRGEAIEAGGLSEPQNHPRALELGKHHGVVMIPRETQAESQRGMQSVWVHRDADHTDAGTDKDGGHVLREARHDNIRRLGAVSLQGRRGS